LIRDYRRDVYHVPGFLLFHLRNHLLGHVKETGHIGIHHQIVIIFGVVSERLGNVNSGIVNQEINPAEMLKSGVYCVNRGFFLAGVSTNKDEMRRRLELIRLTDGAGDGDDAPILFEELGLGRVLSR
jgi:hypothetical protein